MRRPLFLMCTNKDGAYIIIVSQGKEGGESYALRMVSFYWPVRFGAGMWYFDLSHLSGGSAPVPCGIFADWLWLRVYAQVGKEKRMKIVVVKSPKFLKGILRMLFGIRE